MVMLREDSPDLPLSKSEKLYVWRRRLGLTQTEMAAKVGVGSEEWRGAELGTDLDALGRIALPGPVRPTRAEMMVLWRRRRGWSIKEAAAYIGTSHVTLIAHERGEGSWEATESWWKERLGA